MKCKATEIIRLFGGRIGLTAGQAIIRKHNLKPVEIDGSGGGIYEITGPIVFKVGEIIDIIEPDKAQLSKLEILKKEKQGEKKAIK